MEYSFAYKIGHNPELSINEYIALTGDTKFKIKGFLLYSNSDIDITQAGSLVFKALVTTNLVDLPKKIGYVTVAPVKSHPMIIKQLKAQGAKKILISNKEPNIGQFKYVGNWFMEVEDHYLQIVQNSDQEYWNRLDMDLPAKDMKKGIINIKLARSMLNLTKYTNICDPFAGLGRNAAAGWNEGKKFVLSDLDPACKIHIDENIKFLNQYYGKQSEVLKNETLNAKDIVDNFGEEFAIVTEGHLTEAANYVLSYNEAESRVAEVKELWMEVLTNWSKIDNLRDIVFTLPFYITRSKDIYWDIVHDLPKELTLVPFFNDDYIFYKRPNTRIGHMIVRLTK
jgi:hypothetical protein